ncbi:amydohydolase [Bacillus sp. OxB-1]|uniref:M20 peptidase aminoacylase family protein n=1 Tax=Bacillus sp. (strain OxB-1) TaxID=98228 RepID=UPI000581FA2F|nr:M20 peptidase aminoacylase family protein [Bacillus sp. OxB-1]BAQ10072.1 amydohydolase [Bacillus sp. OxB-1]
MKELIQQIQSDVNEIFDHLHTNPEISWKEVETTRYLKERLEAEGFAVSTFDDMTGLVAEIGTGAPCIGLRSDIDALWQEVDGVYQANHSCGHDAHMTITLGAMLLLKKLGIPKQGRLKVLFQPAEEKGTGALALVNKGVVDDIDYLFGLHMRPIQEIRHGYAAPAILHGAAKTIKGKIIGTEAHGARPHLGQNAIEVAAMLVQSIHAIHVDPVVPHSAKMTMFQAGGESSNIIPGTGVFSLDLRAQTNVIMAELEERVQNAIRSVASLFGVEIEYEASEAIAAAEVDDSAVQLMAQAIEDTLGTDFVKEPIVTPGGEDFHFYTLKRPNIKATMLGLGCDLAPGLHHPQMSFNRDSLLTGIEIMARTVIHAFEQLEKEK